MRQIQIDLSPEQCFEPRLLQEAVRREAGLPSGSGERVELTRRVLDCRSRKVVYHCTALLYEPGEQTTEADRHSIGPHTDEEPKRGDVIIVGAGPAGLFAALRCLEKGLRPIIIERGKPVERRKYDIVEIARRQSVDPDSNWCFGEGGAGTYSDGKLYTRSTKRGDVGAVLRTFVEHGADADILLEPHAHIGTDRLSGIIAAIRQTITAHGGQYLFGQRMQDLCEREGEVEGVLLADGTKVEAQAVILCTGHSARDVYELFFRRGWTIEAKPFAMGVRVEHPQSLIDSIQYHGANHSPLLPPAAYSLTTQAFGRGVFSFCMCPGGLIVPAATAEGQQVVNGMSNHLRNSPYANSGIAVSINMADAEEEGPLALLHFQQKVEQKMFEAAGGCIAAPTQRLTDFLSGRPSQTLGKSGYMGQCISAPLHELLPKAIVRCLKQGFKDFDRKMHGFLSEEAQLLAVESRTSSPVRIPRDSTTLQHPQLRGLYPCGEGAGYAGGIVSSAIDGVRCADAVSLQM